MWKVLGVAGLASVAATGVVVARSERRRRAFAPDDVRARLHQRLQEAAVAEATIEAPPVAKDDNQPGCLGATCTRLRAAILRRRAR